MVKTSNLNSLVLIYQLRVIGIKFLLTEPLENFFPMMAISFAGNFYMRQAQHGQFIMGQGDKDEKPGINYNVTFKFEKELTVKMVELFPFLRNLRIMRHWSGMYNMSQMLNL